jgi:hypothetical protein
MSKRFTSHRLRALAEARKAPRPTNSTSFVEQLLNRSAIRNSLSLKEAQACDMEEDEPASIMDADAGAGGDDDCHSALLAALSAAHKAGNVELATKINKMLADLGQADVEEDEDEDLQQEGRRRGTGRQRFRRTPANGAVA